MGLFFDLIQDSQISKQRTRADSLEERIENLETELQKTRQALYNLLIQLEKHFGQDIDKDGKIGE